MYLGRYTNGQVLPLRLVTVDASDTATTPDDVPTVEIWNAALITPTKAYQAKMPVLDGVSTGNKLFGITPRIGTDFNPTLDNLCTVIYRWTLSGTVYLRTDTFDAVAGGGAAGDTITMFCWVKPGRVNVIQQQRAGAIITGTNPSVP